MAQQTTIYDLVLLLSTAAADEERAKILADIETAVSAAGGSIERNQEWGTRPMTYRINHQADAEYHLLQFSGPPALLESLSHSLRIADSVLRFRIIKVIPGMPPPSDSAPPVVAAAGVAGSGSGSGSSGGGSPGSSGSGSGEPSA
jgi:small subunit ribosomal protein S6